MSYFVDYLIGFGATTPCYFRMSEASGNLASATSADVATANGAPTYGAAGPVPGEVGITFPNAATTFFSIASSVPTNVGDTFSILAWVKKAADGTLMTIISRAATGYTLDIDAANKLSCSKNGTGVIATSTTTITGTGWHMVAVVKNAGTSFKLYIDGVDVTGVVTNQTIAATGTATEIGRLQGAAQPFNGSISEIFITAAVLTASQISQAFAVSALVPNFASGNARSEIMISAGNERSQYRDGVTG